MHDTVDVLAPEAGTTALGSAFGSREHINARAWEISASLRRAALCDWQRGSYLHQITRQCADVSKLMYLRNNGDILDQDLLRASVSASLNGDLPDHSWWQTTTGVTCGGLGLRTALGITLAALCAAP